MLRLALVVAGLEKVWFFGGHNEGPHGTPRPRPSGIPPRCPRHFISG